MYTKPAVLALLLATTSATNVQVNKQAAVQIVEGVLKGAI
jgi:hypothetical protein